MLSCAGDDPEAGGAGADGGRGGLSPTLTLTLTLTLTPRRPNPNPNPYLDPNQVVVVFNRILDRLILISKQKYKVRLGLDEG